MKTSKSAQIEWLMNHSEMWACATLSDTICLDIIEAMKKDGLLGSGGEMAKRMSKRNRSRIFGIRETLIPEARRQLAGKLRIPVELGGHTTVPMWEEATGYGWDDNTDMTPAERLIRDDYVCAVIRSRRS